MHISPNLPVRRCDYAAMRRARSLFWRRMMPSLLASIQLWSIFIAALRPTADRSYPFFNVIETMSSPCEAKIWLSLCPSGGITRQLGTWLLPRFCQQKSASKSHSFALAIFCSGARNTGNLWVNPSAVHLQRSFKWACALGRQAPSVR